MPTRIGGARTPLLAVSAQLDLQLLSGSSRRQLQRHIRRHRGPASAHHCMHLHPLRAIERQLKERGVRLRLPRSHPQRRRRGAWLSKYGWERPRIGRRILRHCRHVDDKRRVARASVTHRHLRLDDRPRHERRARQPQFEVQSWQRVASSEWSQSHWRYWRAVLGHAHRAIGELALHGSWRRRRSHRRARRPHCRDCGYRLPAWSRRKRSSRRRRCCSERWGHDRWRNARAPGGCWSRWRRWWRWWSERRSYRRGCGRSREGRWRGLDVPRHRRRCPLHLERDRRRPGSARRSHPDEHDDRQPAHAYP